jgi:hypothetical protein
MGRQLPLNVSAGVSLCRNHETVFSEHIHICPSAICRLNLNNKTCTFKIEILSLLVI